MYSAVYYCAVGLVFLNKSCIIVINRLPQNIPFILTSFILNAFNKVTQNVRLVSTEFTVSPDKQYRVQYYQLGYFNIILSLGLEEITFFP